MLFPLVIGLVIFYQIVDSCTNIIISPGASVDSSSLVAYNADSGTLYGLLYHYPAADHDKNAMRDVYDWDSGKYLGQIKEVEHTYNVVGNMNEYGLMIGETTFGGISVLQSQPDAKIDYGSLIWITLQRSKTAREAITTIAELMSTYGYASGGESFSIADANEAWIMEIIGKGSYEKGAVWVAMKLPDGYVTAHANQARITTFPLYDSKTCLYATDTISFAKKIGLYPTNSPDEEFSFSDIYDPISFTGARFCEARVWSFFSSVMGTEWSSQYEDYVTGYNLTNRMPLFVKPTTKISLSDTMQYMRNHYESTILDMSGQEFNDVGSVYSSQPYRIHPLTYTSTINPDGTSTSETLNTYLHERPIATQQTGWNFIGQSRRWMPIELQGILWFGVDDSATTVRFPIYGSTTKVPESFAGKGSQDGVASSMMKFSIDSAFYVFNLVANWAYNRWDLIYPVLYSTILSKEMEYMDMIKEIDSKAIEIYNTKGSTEAIKYITENAIVTGNKLVKDWFELFGELFVKYRDGYIITSDPTNTACGCSVTSEGYPQKWLDRIVLDTGSHYYIPDDTSIEKKGMSSIDTSKNKSPWNLQPVSKLQLLRRK